MSNVRYLFDEQFPYAVAAALRRQGIDVLTAAEAGLRSAADGAYLQYSLRTNRVLVTEDRDFLRRHAAGEQHSGIAYCAHGSRSIRQMVDSLVLIHEVLSARDMTGAVEFL